MKNYADLGGCYPPQPSASADNTLLDLHNSSYHTQPHPIIANYAECDELISIAFFPTLVRGVPTIRDFTVIQGLSDVSDTRSLFSRCFTKVKKTFFGFYCMFEFSFKCPSLYLSINWLADYILFRDCLRIAFSTALSCG